MAKQEIELKNLKGAHARQSLRTVLPWLSRDFRRITKAEARTKKVFIEFFGDESFKQWKLKAIFEYQKYENETNKNRVG